MNQALYAHMNNKTIIKKRKCVCMCEKENNKGSDVCTIID
jgi:hypothetical protein